MSDWKLVVGVLGGSLLLIALAAFGLSKMASGESGLEVSVEKLVEGAEWIDGDESVKVTVVEFACLQCSACRAADPISIKLRQMEGVRYVWRYFPLTATHKNALVAAKAAEAAYKLDKGWEMADLLFEKQSEWSDKDDFFGLAVSYASDLGLDGDSFTQMYNSAEVEEQIGKDRALVGRLKIKGTPTFFVNGKLTASSFVISEVEKLLSESE